MIDHELLFLGLLVDKPKHGYEIKRQIEEELLPTIGLKIKSIYYPLKRMEEEGLIEKEVGREGKFPEKQIYKITDLGKKRFDQIVEASFLNVERPFFQMNLSLYFLPFVNKRVAVRRLKARLSLLRRIHTQMILLGKSAKSTSQALILDHDIGLVEAEIASTQRLIVQI